MKKSLSLILRYILCLLVVLAFVAGITNFYKIEKNEMVSVEGRTFEKAKVVEITRDNLQENGTRTGEQQVIVKMLSG